MVWGGSAGLKDRGTKPASHIQFPTDRHVDLVGGGELLDSLFALERITPSGTLA